MPRPYAARRLAATSRSTNKKYLTAKGDLLYSALQILVDWNSDKHQEKTSTMGMTTLTAKGQRDQLSWEMARSARVEQPGK